MVRAAVHRVYGGDKRGTWTDFPFDINGLGKTMIEATELRFMGVRRYPAIWVDDKLIPIHRLVAEEALGKLLPPGAVVHHINEDPRDFSKDNLVICQDAAYHSLIHYRAAQLGITFPKKEPSQLMELYAIFLLRAQ